MAQKHTVSFISLGCPKNLVDSEGLVSTLLSRGFRVLDDPKDADLVVVNTCGFLAASRSESVDTIKEAVALKDGGVQGVLVAGCMVGNYKDQIEKEAPGVDRFVPFVDYSNIDGIAEELLPKDPSPSFTVERRRVDAALTPGHYAYLKISEGCNHTCAFCVIPDIRGPMRSLPEDDLVARARTLAERGVKELVVIAQDSTVYGTDLYGSNRTSRLLHRLDSIEGIEWIRLMYAYPTEVRDELIETLATSERVLPYLDVPMQHASDSVLKRMRRGYGRARLSRMVQDLRDRVPDIALRTTFIVGFPGETDADFEELLDFVREARVERLGAFRYSDEAGSRAADLDGQVPESVKDERYDRLMMEQQQIAFAHNEASIGTTESVLVDAAAVDGHPAVARRRRDAPEVDASVFIQNDALRPGDLIQVEITGASGYDLRATLPG
ncbi:MAG: 30S ribosomal protein S12 methylthiotransferase RimO [Planctomycetota bacterium]|nr:30S ribosomal protein S12 methylthiotransferase RimO [Planctomycetota bacterium]